MIGYNEYGGPLKRFGSRLVNGLYSQLARYIIRFTELYTVRRKNFRRKNFYFAHITLQKCRANHVD